MKNNRTGKSLRNSIVSLITQIMSVLISFVVRTIFIKYLGTSYLGINGLFSNILSLLSFAELGFGTAIIYAMYTPLAENNEKKISAYMNLYATIYRVIGCFILIIGTILIPFLSFFIGDMSQIPKDLPPIWIIYMLYLINSASSYFFNYKRSIIIASQNGYIDSINQMGFILLRNLLQIVVLIKFRSFVLYLIVQIISTIAGNIAISLKADKLFPYMKEYRKEKVEKKEIKIIEKNVLAMACHKFGAVIVSGTDNILITKFDGIAITGQYSNYELLKNTIRTVYLQILDPITASVGNMIATENKEKTYKLFERIFFINAYIAIIFTTCLINLSSPFVQIFWGKECVIDKIVVFIIMLNFYINCLRKTSQIYIDTTGLFWQIKWKSIIEAIINLLASIILGYYLRMGILGVLVGTLISNVTTNLWWEPYVVYKEYFERSLLLYFKEYFKFFVVLILSNIILLIIRNFLSINIFNFILLGMATLIVPNILIYFLYNSNVNYKYYRDLIKNILIKMIKKEERT